MNRLFKHGVFWVFYLLFQAYIEFVWIKSSYSSISEIARFLIALKVEVILLIPKLFFAYWSVALIRTYTVYQNLWRLILKILLSLLISILAYRLLTHYIILPFIYNDVDPNPYSILRYLMASIDIVTIAGVFHVIKLFKQQLENAQREKQLLKSKLETELNYLKSQTNPHFLFNTLNNIYGLSKKNSSSSSEAILKLSKILRFMIYGTRKPLITIEEEMDIIKNYIELEQLRYSSKLDLQFDFYSNASANIAPLILLPFVENAFKHGVSESTDSAYVYINCTLNDLLELRFSVKNSVDVMEKNETEEGIGLENVKRQLQLLYKIYSLDIADNDSTFEVNLFIDLKSYEPI